MAAIDNLTQAVNNLNATVTKVVTALGSPAAADAQIQAAADAINSLDTQLTNALPKP